MGKSLLYGGMMMLFFHAMGLNSLQAQLSADFSANRTEGCAPLVVQFRDQSTGNPNSWYWDLGNGTVSFLKDPAATYFNPGSYTIKLVISNGVQSDSVVKTQYIVVHESPTINFTASDTTGCFPLSIRFTDLSLPGDGNIISWLWDFGDGDTSAIANPAHTYSSQGNYNVSLQVRNSSGCIQSITRLNYIKLNNGVKAAFVAGSAANCKPPTAISFINQSTGTGQLNYEWFFGDGTTSTQTNPQHVYNNPGSYTVKLLVRNNTGCVDSLVLPNAIVIGTVQAAFVIPATVCAGVPLTLANTSSPAPAGSYWDFGDGTSSTIFNPSKTYSTAGDYSIKLVADFGACKDSVIKPLRVLPKPQTSFNANTVRTCQPPLQVQFRENSTGAVSYKWFFGDGDSSLTQQPIHTYTSYGRYTVTLITTNAAGCSDTLRKPDWIVIEKPQVAILPLPQEGCIPFSFQPLARVLTADSLVQFHWDFGDGSTADMSNPQHTYTTAGIYTIKLFYTTAGGCSDSVVVQDAVRVGHKPQTGFSATPRYACAFQNIRFKDESTGAPIDRWQWEFGDGGSSSIQNPGHLYQDTGWFNIRLYVWSNGCRDSLVLPRYIYIKPPIARFRDSSDCHQKFTRWFRDQSIGATSWTWDFGDGTSSSLQNPVHTYQSSGNFRVTLTVKNDTCEHSYTRQVMIIAETAQFTVSDTVICKGTPLQFASTVSQQANIASYRWNFGDGLTGSGSNPSHVYTQSGVYSVQLVITDRNGCSDTLNRPLLVRVNGPTADFTAINPSVCRQSLVSFADSSVSDGTHPLQTWIWNYGDGRTDTLWAPPFQYQYNNAGQYTVSLTVIDNLGCKDTRTRPALLLISQPVVSFSSPDTLSCVDKPIRFINQSAGNGPLHFEWNFGNGNNSNAVQPVFSYSLEGDYAVKLMVTDRFGCRDSLFRPQYIHIKNPRSFFVISDSVATCPPLVVNFTNQSQNFIRHEWDFGDGTRSTVSNPVHFYTYPGTYKARLVVTGPGGCADTLVRTITVRGPQGNFRYDQLTGCEPTQIRFTGTTKDTVSFIWDFGDGTVIQTGDSLISHLYTRRGFYVPKMILKDPQGCQVSIAGRDTIRIYGVEARFGNSRQYLCDSGLVQFTDSSLSNDLITSYQWDLGDGSVSTLRNPSHFYRQPGQYSIKLAVVTRMGCRSQVQAPLPIKITQTPVLDIRSTAPACIPATASFQGLVIQSDTNRLSWKWEFGNGAQSEMQAPDPVLYQVEGSYQVRLIGKNNFGCADTVTHTYVAWPLPDVEAGADRWICREAMTDLIATGALSYTWGPDSHLSCLNCAAPKAAPLENTKYYVVGKNIHGCEARDSVLIRVQQPFTIEVGKGDTLCRGESTELWAKGADQFTWSPVTGLDNGRSAVPKASPANSVLYRVVGSDNQGCFTDTGYVPVVVYPIPEVNAGDDKTITVGSQVQILARISQDVSGIRWTPASNLSCVGCAQPVASPRQTTTYKVEVSNEGGCVSRDEVTIFVFCEGSNLFVPNTFSPNGDGQNDVFYPRGKGLFVVRNFRVFNRWGELVFDQSNFQANDVTKGWNGIYKGRPASQDVYVYLIEVVCENQTVMQYCGNVTLIR